MEKQLGGGAGVKRDAMQSARKLQQPGKDRMRDWPKAVTGWKEAPVHRQL